MWCSCISEHLERVWSRDGAASPNEHWERKAVYLFNTLSCVVNTYIIFTVLFVTRIPIGGYFWSTCGVLVSTLWVYALLESRQVLSHRVIVFYMGIFIASVLYSELEARAFQMQTWPLLVLGVDFLLVLRVEDRYTEMFVWMTVVCLVVLSAESAFRVGLFDLPGSPTQEERREHYRLLTDCEKVPCAMHMQSLQPALVSSIVFLVDFKTTRSFARQVRKEQEVMQRTISTVQEVSRLLAKYDVEGVARMLSEQQRELPALMHETLKQMEANLRNYRPYLPAALFEERDHPSTARLSPAPPGLESGVATVVFTDIRSSTAIWECAPEGMRLGLQIHNAVLREEMHQYSGYEVKTIGDAFMIAFETTCEGMNFALRTHESLRRAAWPLSLLEEAPICANQGPLWGGLTVRIGINTGPVTVERNVLTGRIDYFGHTVNVASRLEGSCTPGAVTVLSSLWMSECQSCNAAVGATQALELKGVADTVFVVSVWPVSLAGRETSPLREGVLTENTSFMTYSSSNSAFTPYLEPTGIPATVGVMELADTSAPLRVVSMGLSALTAQLDQSGGMLVALLGNCVCAGWNLTRCAPAHMENAVRFAQRAQRAKISNGTGLVSGLVRHGDVGSRTQRFVTVIGDPVRRSWTLCEAAVRGGGLCLYEPPSDVEMPSALNHMLEPDAKCKGLYKVVNVSRDNTG